uniref:Uncharacterized protein n=1 Tax=Fibrocapsa japonica TaxID=94617 RepID=A0A7S2XW71_9STRA|mmetsp:Transcript_15127/g.22286  ORF Transcript_15127/g.22286 Transcript_15127/m.22286 type:complete len:165 (+) Transcript_15127:104-598(+)|eukprot:CAMPEP_0113943290 /NCGR_PEP_ID=MMETSP1339-20121228/23165_1 /TAXON_ID=94617 /ORGANISM="Fibrocapsa japonica" /LENGTH=164 /DNA_ID=CAMNT_0000948127 /DNA_START=102 /DNA_END=599 /DNA_ORIENTATION=- /assembly_acc=CAM_ASM_000762
MNLSYLYVQGRQLSDGGMYIISVTDLDPAGVLIKAYNQVTSSEYYLSPSEDELEEAGLSRQKEDLKTLVESIDLTELSGGRTFLRSSLAGIKDPKVIPQGAEAAQFIKSIPAGTDTLPELLTTALSELCKVKPSGLDAVRWLGQWLLENNPNQPQIEEPIVEEA